MAGNIGSPKRMDYTVIGDSVNLAARLEGATKFYGAPVLVSEPTIKEMRNQALLREIDLMRVKGKDEPIAAFEVLDHHTEATFPNLEQTLGAYGRGLELYRARDWKKARPRSSARSPRTPRISPRKSISSAAPTTPSTRRPRTGTGSGLTPRSRR